MKKDPWDLHLQCEIHMDIRLLFAVLRLQTLHCRFPHNGLFPMFWPHFPTRLTWSLITQCELHSPLLELLSQQKTTARPPLTLIPSPLTLLRYPETKKMSGSGVVLCILVLSFLHSHCPLGKNHPGRARHRDQRYTLLLPDALCGATSHL